MFHRWWGFTVLLCVGAAYPPNGVEIIDHYDFEHQDLRPLNPVELFRSEQGCKCMKDDNNNKWIDCSNLNLYNSEIYFPECQDIYKLDLSHNNLNIVNASRLLSAQQRKDLTVLDLSNSYVGRITTDLLQVFPNMKMLNLTNNVLVRALDEDFDYFNQLFNQTNQLSFLYLDNNMLPALPLDSFKNSHLAVLSLRNNPDIYLYWRKTSYGDPKYSSHDYEFNSELEVLDLSNCNMPSISPKIGSLSRLRVLNLAGNNFEAKDLKIVENLPSLKYLDLSEAPFVYYLRRGWLNNTNLISLTMKNMPNLWGADACAFCDLPKLYQICLSGSRNFRVLKNQAFGYDIYNNVFTPALIDITNCSIETMEETLVDWPRVKQLSIGGNPWNCDSRLSWLFGIDKNVLDQGEPYATCKLPLELKNRRIKDIHAVQNMRGDTNLRPIEPKGTTFSWIKENVNTEAPKRIDPDLIVATTEETKRAGYIKRLTLSEQLVAKLQELYRRARTLSAEPKTNFVMGVLAGLVGLFFVYQIIKLACKLVKFVWFLLTTYVFPHIASFCRTVGPPLGTFIVTLGMALLVIARACFELLRQKTAAYVPLNSRQNLDTVSLVVDAEKQAQTGQATTPIRSETVFVYNRDTDHATIVH